jgi:Flp pilus assembly protein TadD
VFCKRTTSPALTITSFILIATLIGVEQGCARARATAVERLGVMPIENLSSNAQLDWPSRAAAAVLVYDLAGAKKLFAGQVNSLSDAQSMQASRLLEGYYFERNGRIGIRATLEDLTKNRAIERFEIDGTEAAGFLPLANEVARRVSSDARTFGTSQEKALRFYGEAMDAQDSKGAELALEQATDADPGFAAAYVEEAKLLAQTGDRERVRQTAEAGERARLDPIDRANLEYVVASASGDANDRIKALESLTAATPANAGVFRELGEIRFARREFPQAAIEYRAAANLDADDTRIWNELGYALAWAKDLKGAGEALDQYQRLAPGDINAVDSQGEVHYMLGDFEPASSYFGKAGATNPVDLVKAAEARLMLGDRPGADALFAKHLGPNGRGLSKGAEYQLAQWEVLTGRHEAGMARMEKLAQELNGDSQALALSQLAIWKLETGETKTAADLANQAADRAVNPQSKGISALCQHVVSGSTGSGSKMTDALALVFAKRFQDALPSLQAVYGETNPSGDGQIRTLLAWAYMETGAVDKAASLVDTYPLPMSSGEPLFASLIFPRFLAVRAAVLERQGKAQEAKRARELYSMYAGTTK